MVVEAMSGVWAAGALGVGIGLVLGRLCDLLCRREAGLTGSRWDRRLQWAGLAVLATLLCACLQRSYGWSLQFLRLLSYSSLLLLIAAVDLRTRLVPNVLTASGLVLALVLSLAFPSPGLLSAIEGAALACVLFLVLALVGGNAMGFGDVKLAALIGLMTGFPWVVQALIIGIMLGGLAAAVFLLVRLRRPKQYIPYAPYLAAGAIATLLCGPRIANWYAAFRRGKG
jgi:prepilin signal peptidase PulO-like enzyme (type II secretory pathway)